MTKKILKKILLVILVILLIVVGYFVYVFASYYRLEDNLELSIYGEAANDSIATNTQYRISSYNIGFGAYSDDYSFFMDGGTESWAYSEEAVNENVTGSVAYIGDIKPDIMLFQEVDTDSTRSYHVDEEALIIDDLAELGYTDISYGWAQNYDSPFLFYPITQPHGKSVAGELTASTFTIQNCIRRSLPIEEGFSKLIDLDRCYSKNYIDADTGNQLVVYNVHLSAYTTDPSTAENQIIMLNEDMSEEVAKGNYVIAGGDMNKDLLGDSSKYFDCETLDDNWAQPFPTELLSDEFSLVAAYDETNPVPSARNADEPYHDGQFVVTIDGFIVSSNVEVVSSAVYDGEFKYSDHNPIYMDFILK